MIIDVKQVARELGVRYLVQGSVPQGRATGSASRHRWSRLRAGISCGASASTGHSMTCSALQDEIALNVVSAIEPKLAARRSRARKPQAAGTAWMPTTLVLQAPGGRRFRHARPSDKGTGAARTCTGARPNLCAWRTPNAPCANHCLFLRRGLAEEDRLASVRYAQAAIAHGRDDPARFDPCGFSIGMDGHDRAAAFIALEAAFR